jgi:hypothetical protein
MFPYHKSDTVSYHTTTKIETHIHVDPQEIEILKEDYMEDPYFAEILANLMEPEVRYKMIFKTPNDLIHFNDPLGQLHLCIPKPMTKQLIEEVHNSHNSTAHRGFEKTYAHLSGLFYWPYD